MFYSPHKDASLEGLISGAAPGNASTKFDFIMPYDRIFNGIESFAQNSNMGDNITFRIFTPDGQGGWTLYKKLGKKWYVTPNALSTILLYLSVLKSGVKLEFEYQNVGTEPIKFFINGYLHREQDIQIGADW